MIGRVAIIPLGLCAITYRLLATPLHYRTATLPSPLSRMLLCFEYSCTIQTPRERPNHRRLRDRDKALALNVLIHPCFESFALRRLFEARRRRSLACHSHTKKSLPRGGPLIQPHPEFLV